VNLRRCTKPDHEAGTLYSILIGEQGEFSRFCRPEPDDSHPACPAITNVTATTFQPEVGSDPERLGRLACGGAPISPAVPTRFISSRRWIGQLEHKPHSHCFGYRFSRLAVGLFQKSGKRLNRYTALCDTQTSVR